MQTAIYVRCTHRNAFYRKGTLRETNGMYLTNLGVQFRLNWPNIRHAFWPMYSNRTFGRKGVSMHISLWFRVCMYGCMYVCIYVTELLLSTFRVMRHSVRENAFWPRPIWFTVRRARCIENYENINFPSWKSLRLRSRGLADSWKKVMVLLCFLIA